MNVSSDNVLTGRVIGAAIAVHRELGPGLNESVYETTLSAELSAGGVYHECQVPLPLRYKGVKLDCGYRMDLLIEGRLIVELKSVEAILPIHEAQLLTYLRLTSRELGLLINFDVAVLKRGVRRRIWTPDYQRPTKTPANSEKPGAGFEPLSSAVLAAAIEVHRTLGPGLLRSAYEECLCHELSVRGIAFERAKKLPARFRELEIAEAVEIPLLVAGELPVACLSVAELTGLDQARLLARLRQGGWPSGLLLNFNVSSLPGGIRRVVNSVEKDRGDD
ncbi:MAG: GxxExxY protein [Pirellulaceae bacterium]|nr:GxxExxY protein [Pirellulaceae bacterium]